VDGVGGTIRLSAEKGSALGVALSSFTEDEPEYHELVAHIAMLIMHRSLEKADRIRRAQRKIKTKRSSDADRGSAEGSAQPDASCVESWPDVQ
jgi:hypothetical protein